MEVLVVQARGSGPQRSILTSIKALDCRTPFSIGSAFQQSHFHHKPCLQFQKDCLQLTITSIDCPRIMAGSNPKFGRDSPVSKQPDPPRSQSLVTRKPKPQVAECPNQGWWSRGHCRTYISSFEKTKSPSAAGKSVESQLRQAISDFFCQSGIKPCQFEKCEDFRKSCRLALPDCEWKEFRNWVVNWIACWMQSQHQSVSLPRCYQFMISDFLTHLVQ